MLVVGIVGLATELIYVNVSHKERKQEEVSQASRTRILRIEYTDGSDDRLNAFFEVIKKYTDLELIQIIDSSLYE